MNIVFFAHPSFLGQQSMSRYVRWLAEGMRQRGHTVEVWSPSPTFFNLSLNVGLKKWLGYIDQYIMFPMEVKRRRNKIPKNTLFVFTDHALGPWIRLIGDQASIIHCHDFLAQFSALGKYTENYTGFTGRKYQKFIRRGYTQGRNYISVSKKTKEDLHKFLHFQPKISVVVYNGLNSAFQPGDLEQARVILEDKTGIDLSKGYILHIGGNQWYKNRVGLIEIYNAWRLISKSSIPLLMIGQSPSPKLRAACIHSSYKADIHLLSNINDDILQLSYIGASVFLFPSIAEGFGWPIAEAMASGCPVITTNEAPMTEVAGDAAFFIAKRPAEISKVPNWATEAAKVVSEVLGLSINQRAKIIQAGIENAERFNTKKTLDEIEKIYSNVLEEELKQQTKEVL